MCILTARSSQGLHAVQTLYRSVNNTRLEASQSAAGGVADEQNGSMPCVSAQVLIAFEPYGRPQQTVVTSIY